MKGTLELFKQSLDKSAKAHNVRYEDDTEHKVIRFETASIPLMADMQFICEAIFENTHNAVFQDSEGKLVVCYRERFFKKEVDEQTLKLALPKEEAEANDDSYTDALVREAKKNLRHMKIVADEMNMRGGILRVMLHAFCSHWEERSGFGAICARICDSVLAVARYINFNHQHNGEETSEEKEGYAHLGKEIDLTSIPKEFRTVFFDEGDKHMDLGWPHRIKNCVPVKVYLDKIACIDGGLVGAADYYETVLRLQVTTEDGEKKTEYYNDLGCNTFDFFGGQYERIMDILDCAEHLHGKNIKVAETPTETPTKAVAESQVIDDEDLPF